MNPLGAGLPDVSMFALPDQAGAPEPYAAPDPQDLEPSDTEANVDLTAEQKKKIERLISEHIQVGEQARMPLKARWDQNEALYRNEVPEMPAMHPKVTKPTADHHVPLMGPRIDNLIGVTVDTVTSSLPYCVARAMGRAQPRMDDQEEDLQTLLDLADFEFAIEDLARDAATCGRSIAWVRFEATTPEYDRNIHVGQLAEGDLSYCGIVIEPIHPADFVLYPANVKHIRQAKLAAHRSSHRLQEIEELQQLGRYYSEDDDSKVSGGEDPHLEDAAGRNPMHDLVNTSDMGTDPKDEQLTCWYGYVRLDLDGDGYETLYHFVFAEKDERLLFLRPHLLNNCPYIDFRFHRQPGIWWPSNSVAYNLNALQLVYNELHNLLIDGSWITALPPAFVEGTAMFQDDNESIRYSLGEMFPVHQGQTVTTTTPRFQPIYIPSMIQQVERVADQVAGISQNGSGSQMRNATATEVEAVQQGQDRAVSRHINNFSEGVIHLVAYAAVLFRTNFPILKERYQDRLKCEQPPDEAIFSLNGSRMNSTPQYQLSIAQLLAQFAQDPEYGLVKWEIGRMILNASRIPNREIIQMSKEQTQMQVQMMQLMAMMQAGAENGADQAEQQQKNEIDKVGQIAAA